MGSVRDPGRDRHLLHPVQRGPSRQGRQQAGPDAGRQPRSLRQPIRTRSALRLPAG